MKRFQIAIPFVVILFLALPLSGQIINSKYDIPAQQHQIHYPDITVLDQVRAYYNGIYEFIWTVPDPASMLDGEYVPRKPEHVSQLFMLCNQDVLGINNPDSFVHIETIPTGNEKYDVVFEQHYKEIPILTTRLVMTVEDKMVTYTMGRIIPDTSILYSGPAPDGDAIIQKYLEQQDDNGAGSFPIIKIVYFPTPQKVHYSFELIEEVMNGGIEIYLDAEGDDAAILEKCTAFYNP